MEAHTVHPSALHVEAVVGTANAGTERLLRKRPFHIVDVLKTAGALAKAIDQQASKLDRAARAGKKVTPTVLMVDVALWKGIGPDVTRRLGKRTRRIPVVMFASPSQIPEAAKAVESGIAQEYLVTPFRADDLMARVKLATTKAAAATEHERELDAPLAHLVEDLHDKATGRLDARFVATFFGLKLGELLPALGRKAAAVYKTPDADSLQAPLQVLETIASGLVRLTGSPKHARMWLRSANPALDTHAPIELLTQGKVNALADFVQDLLEGSPA